MTPSISCKKCGSEEYVRNGHARGHQRYKCKRCGCQFTDTKPRGVDPALKKLAVVLYGFCGVSLESIGRLFKVSGVAVLKWIRAAAAQVELQKPETSPEVVIINEM